MRSSLAIAVLILGVSASGMAEQKYRVKHSAPERTSKNATVPLVTKAGGSANAKDLQALEHETARSATPHNSAKKTPGAAAFKPIKDKPNPPINLGGGGGANAGGGVRQSGNPYQGRLKQKYGRQH